MNLEKFQYSSSKGLSLVLEKHGEHDQKTHGNWATGSEAGGVNLDAPFDTTLTAKDGTKVTVVTQSKTYMGGNKTSYVGILTVDGEQIGDWERGVGPDYVSCTGLVLGDWRAKEKSPFAEKGIGTEFHKRTEEIAKALGKENIIVNAVSDGSSVWATEKFGYKFDSSKGVPNFARLPGLYAPSLSYGKETYFHPFMENPENRKQVTSILETFKGAPSQWATPSQILSIGKNGPKIRSTDNYRVGVYRDYTMGEYMLSSGWNGIKSSEHITKMASMLKLHIVGVESDVTKHGTHDQKTHGSWADGSEGKVLTSLIDRLAEKRTPGFSIDIRTKKSPKTGYMCSIDGAERKIKLGKWNSLDNDGKRAIIERYKKANMEALSKRGAYFGAWKSVQDGVIYLDVSRRYESKSEGISAGIANKQKSIYDVVKDAYIYMEDENGGTKANKAYAGGVGQTPKRDDPRGIGRADGRNLGSDRGQSLNRHVCLGRYTVEKHRQGEHDQATHGNWAGDRYPTDSVKSARDGAKEYAFKKGLTPDETIDYKNVVANRERAARIADVYETLPKMDRDAVDEYEALASEVEEQFDFMTKTLGVKVEFVDDDPYKTSKEMFDDVSRGTLKVLKTETTGAHPLFSDAQNDKFRAVHDYFGHAATGRGFGQDGEEAAWVHHSQMFTQNARAALTTETRGQNSFFNNRGKQFADQKVALLPEEFWAVPATFSKVKIIRFAAGLKPVFKHEQHDQSTHGSWANGQTSKGIDENEIFSRYKDFALSDMESSKVEFYIQRGPDLNRELRTNSAMVEGKVVEIGPKMADKALKEIDEAIERAPAFPNREVFRVAPAFLVEGMKVGTVVTDLAYQSTTIADLTKPENGILLLSLSKVTSGQKSLIKINTGSKGKGLYLPAVSKDPVAAHEQEFLLPRGTKLRYTGNEKFQSSTIHKFEVVDDD